MKLASMAAASCLCVLALCSCAPNQTEPSKEGAAPQPVPPKELTLDLGNNITMKLMLIPAGKFMMGCPNDEKDRSCYEGPQHEVTISKPFYMGVYEVTQEQYEQVMGKNPSSFKGAQNPVERVSWYDAVGFCKKLSQKTGKTIQLPTEAQWEYACRAGSKTRFCFGDNDNQLGGYARFGKANAGTAPVGRYEPNAFELYDMHGNVLEWCSDWYADYYAKADKTDPTAPEGSGCRVLRGGCWLLSPLYCRSAHRYWQPSDIRNRYIGFRVSEGPPRRLERADLK